MNKTKIEWADMVYNPVWGCKNNCEYCYARKINQRFKKIKNWNEPEWIESNFNKTFPKSPSRIFVNSMSDIASWNDDWMDEVIHKIEEYPDLIFMFLSKDYNIYADYYFPKNCWLGYTITSQKRFDEFAFTGYYPEKNIFFISIEPISEEIYIHCKPDWVIVGAETGNRKNKIIPKKEWIEELIDIDIPLFMKNNLKPHWDGKFRQEFPE